MPVRLRALRRVAGERGEVEAVGAAALDDVAQRRAGAGPRCPRRRRRPPPLAERQVGVVGRDAAVDASRRCRRGRAGSAASPTVMSVRPSEAATVPTKVVERRPAALDGDVAGEAARTPCPGARTARLTSRARPRSGEGRDAARRGARRPRRSRSRPGMAPSRSNVTRPAANAPSSARRSMRRPPAELSRRATWNGPSSARRLEPSRLTRRSPVRSAARAGLRVTAAGLRWRSSPSAR